KNKIIDPAFEYTKLSNLITKAEQEANEKKRQEQEKARQAAAESYESSSNYQKSAIKKEYDEDYYQNYNEDESFYSQPKEEHINVQTQKQKTPEIKYYCKMCGDSFRDLRTLLSISCFKSPTRKHIPFEGQNSNIYYCKCCGQEEKEITDGG
ncbi:MAG: hypothetical protein J6Y23_13055, partial [Prevotella sp.]|nr:hypothetical protein [Prevotella sp.]